jgi:cyclopropane fatty-acyl-phospholipid synthase-like methyltransferase
VSAHLHLVDQFRDPRGVLGGVAGWIMALRPSNRARNRWLLQLLDVQPGHRVLELGYGPGFAIATLATTQPMAQIVGVDHSPVMHAQATRRNALPIAAGRVELSVGDIRQLPPNSGPFDRIYSANVLQFIAARRDMLTMMFEQLVPGGVIATCFQPRHRGATDADALRFAEGLHADLRATGFVNLEFLKGPRRPVLAIVVRGRRPHHTSETVSS